jgi:thioredoxin-related protein
MICKFTQQLALLLLVVTPAAVLAAGPDELISTGLSNPGYVDKPAWFKDSFLDLREDLAEASSGNKRLMLYFYQDGCPYCERLIRTNFTQQQITAQAQQGFEIIAINMWGDREVVDLAGNMLTEKQFAVSKRVQFTPTLLFLNENGETIFRANGYYPPEKFSTLLSYVAGKEEGKSTFREYLAKVAPQSSSGQLHSQQDYLSGDLQRQPGDRPLLVLFEQHDCAACDELHGGQFQRPEIINLLGQFDIALIDIWSKESIISPSGVQLPTRRWLQDLGVNYTPSMLFFDERGVEVFRAEAYLRAFHTASVLEYVASGAYRQQLEFQRYVDARADGIRAAGGVVDLWQ